MFGFRRRRGVDSSCGGAAGARRGELVEAHVLHGICLTEAHVLRGICHHLPLAFLTYTLCVYEAFFFPSFRLRCIAVAPLSNRSVASSVSMLFFLLIFSSGLDLAIIT